MSRPSRDCSPSHARSPTGGSPTSRHAGNITRILDAASAIPGTTDGQSECFTYDGLRRLATAYTTTASSCTGNGDGLGLDPYNQAYAYDKVGNITTLTDNGQAATYTYPAPAAGAERPNAVTAITYPGRTDSYAYDDAGHLAARTVDNKQATFTWNPLGQLDQATIDGQDTTMVYDAAGERLIRRDPDGGTTLYLGAVELRLSADQVTAKRYYSSSDGSLVAMREPGGLTWMLAGLHGSTQLAVNATTGAVSRERYLPFGQRRGTDDLPFTDLGFLSKTEDPSTDLTYLGARYYDPTIAKFISTDPELDLRTPEWANAYSYAANNPIDQSDPDGRRVDAGGGSSDKSYGYSRNKNRPNANQNLAKTHHASGKKKTARERKIHKKRIKANEKQRKDIAAWKKRETERSRYQSREAGIAKEDIEAYRWMLQNPGISDENGMVSSRYPSMRQTVKNRIGRKTRESIESESCSSFIPGTRILMADGTTKPIESVTEGDEILTTDPKTGKTTVKSVTAQITSEGIKNLAQISIDKGKGSGVLTATGDHPFWVPEVQEWVNAETLRSGQYLQTSSGTYTQISAAIRWTTGD
ncbi:RHS repeat-associated core domain-containing protein [Nonomuraea harbinensis]|uniref:RHS repeat-associated core domain-containing protein n=1 Tax=Nonomuraea harbinensis TaxID=1286938 RepID=A0ABW1C776_9ACTN|nr:RHS repeat-associated core domain-containing protein [Nonomuraea harbinensis]